MAMDADLVNQMNRALDAIQSQINTLRAAMNQAATPATPTTGTPAGDSRAYRLDLRLATTPPPPSVSSTTPTDIARMDDFSDRPVPTPTETGTLGAPEPAPAP